MGERVPCEYSRATPCSRCKAAGGCAEYAELTSADAARYLPREGQDNLIVPKSCPIPPLTSVIRYGPGYYVIKKGRIIRGGFVRSLPPYSR
ncbi:MAG: hypothetical protein AABZ64_15650 [Nitrospinota bacterium]